MKQTIYSISGAFGINRLSASLHRHRPVILAFHGVTADASDSICNAEGLHLRRPTFERLMTYVARNYRVVPVSRIVDWLEGRAQTPERAVAITFDDGFRNVLTDAAPVLKQLNLPATLFVTTDFVFKGEMLWPDRIVAALAQTREPALDVPAPGGIPGFEVTKGFSLLTREDKLHANRELVALGKALQQHERPAFVEEIVRRLGVDAAMLPTAWDGFRPIDPEDLKLLPGLGITAGAHTCSHPILARLSAAELARELSEPKRTLESATGAACDEFAYPNGGPGDFNAQTRQAVIDAGYRCALTTIKRRVAAGDDCFEIPRCTLTHNHISAAEFAAEVSGLPGALRSLRARAALG